jgi:hypothetical protein
MNELDDLFRTARANEPYLTDAGFTAGVLARLPRPRELPLWLKNVVLLAATAAGSALAAWQLPVAPLAAELGALTLHPMMLAAAAIAVYLGSYAAIWAADRV